MRRCKGISTTWQRRILLNGSYRLTAFFHPPLILRAKLPTQWTESRRSSLESGGKTDRIKLQFFRSPIDVRRAKLGLVNLKQFKVWDLHQTRLAVQTFTYLYRSKLCKYGIRWRKCTARERLVHRFVSLLWTPTAHCSFCPVWSQHAGGRLWESRQPGKQY